jgi:hypothetical protein
MSVRLLAAPSRRVDVRMCCYLQLAGNISSDAGRQSAASLQTIMALSFLQFVNDLLGKEIGGCFQLSWSTQLLVGPMTATSVAGLRTVGDLMLPETELISPPELCKRCLLSRPSLQMPHQHAFKPKQTSDLYRPSDHRLSAKLVPTLAKRGVSRSQRGGSPTAVISVF